MATAVNGTDGLDLLIDPDGADIVKGRLPKLKDFTAKWGGAGEAASE